MRARNVARERCREDLGNFENLKFSNWMFFRQEHGMLGHFGDLEVWTCWSTSWMGTNGILSAWRRRDGLALENKQQRRETNSGSAAKIQATREVLDS